LGIAAALATAVGWIGLYLLLQSPALAPPRALGQLEPVRGPLHLFVEEEHLEVHYVALSEEKSPGSVPVHLDALDKPYLLVLAAEGNAAWQLEEADADLLRGIISFGPDQARVSGVPIDLPVYRFVTHEPLDDLISPVCIGGPRYNTPCSYDRLGGASIFARIDGLIADLTGHHIASIAGALSATEFHLPGLPITQPFREAVNLEAETTLSTQARLGRITERNRSFERRFLAGLQEDVVALLGRHPPLDLADLPSRTTRVAMVAIYGGLHRGHSPHRTSLTYEDFLANASKERATVSVSVATATPTVLVLLSSDPVAWQIDALEGTELTGVFVASQDLSFVRGLADAIPLDITSRQTSDLPEWASFSTTEAEAELDSFLARTFPTREVSLDLHRARLASVLVR